jgi:lipopolysaccharide transport system permease protein
MAAYVLVFDHVFGMRLGEGAPTRAVGAFLVVGMLPWMAFCDAVSRGMNSLVENGALLQKNPLPPSLFPARAVAASAVIYLPLFGMLALFYFPLHQFSGALWYLPLLVAGQFILGFMLAWLLAIFAAAVRDTLQVVGFLLSLGVFTAPILFPAALFPEPLRPLLWLNPMTPLIEGYQHVLLRGQAPEAGSWLGLLAWLAVAALVLNAVSSRSREHLVDWL